jgi:cytoskeleton protein RodZ
MASIEPTASTAGANTAAAAAPPTVVPAGPQPGDRELVLVYRDHSWTEVRDRNGRVLLSAMMVPGGQQRLSGAGPFDLVIGNATDVTLTLDGQKVDLAPYTRHSVARFTLQ